MNMLMVIALQILAKTEKTKTPNCTVMDEQDVDAVLEHEIEDIFGSDAEESDRDQTEAKANSAGSQGRLDDDDGAGTGAFGSRDDVAPSEASSSTGKKSKKRKAQVSSPSAATSKKRARAARAADASDDADADGASMDASNADDTEDAEDTGFDADVKLAPEDEHLEEERERQRKLKLKCVALRSAVIGG